jgi:fibronectin type 3 domain-containing protein
MKGLIFVKKLISGLLALTIAASGSAMVAGAADWRNVDSDTSSITLKWNAVSGADGYRVYRWDKKDDKYVTVKTVAGKKTFLKITGLKAGSTYKYVVKPFRYTSTSHTDFGSKSSAVIASTKPAATKVNSKTRSSAKAVAYSGTSMASPTTLTSSPTTSTVVTTYTATMTRLTSGYVLLA